MLSHNHTAGNYKAGSSNGRVAYIKLTFLEEILPTGEQI